MFVKLRDAEFSWDDRTETHDGIILSECCARTVWAAWLLREERRTEEGQTAIITMCDAYSQGCDRLSKD